MQEAVQYLDKGDCDEVKKLSFGTFLDLSIGDLKQRHRQPIDSLVRKVTVEQDRIAIRMRDGVILYLIPELISLLMNLPRGDMGPLDCNPQKNIVELANCRTELGVESLKVENVVEVLKKTKDRKLKVKCFMLLVISRILMPTTTTKTINTNVVMYTKRWTPLKTLTGAL